MKSKKLAAALLVAAGTSSALAMATPAQADPAGGSASPQMDQAFLQALKDNGIQMKSDEAALSLAHSTCDVLTSTGSVQDAMQYVKKSTNWTSIDKIGHFGGLSVQAYCPKAMPKQ
ncbi:MAG: hypothetical protein QOD90_5944 [Mycobacterium sp.]|jgi:hypothetical protein|nr:hypothetical protein [Mycobacterium sp.]